MLLHVLEEAEDAGLRAQRELDGCDSQ